MVKELKPFDKVLVRDYEKSVWTCDLFSYKDRDGRCMCVSGLWNYCVPYEGNEDLLGSYDKPKPKRWRAEHGETYFFVDIDGDVATYNETGCDTDDNLHERGNYFCTKEEAEEIAEKFKKLLNEH